MKSAGRIIDEDQVTVNFSINPNDNLLSNGFYTANYNTDELYFISMDGQKTSLGQLDLKLNSKSRLIFHKGDLIVNRKISGYQYFFKINLNDFTTTEVASFKILDGSSDIRGLSSNGKELFGHYEISSIPQGRLYKIDLNTQSGNAISQSSGNPSILAISFLNEDHYAYSESSDALFEYDITSGKVKRSGSNNGIRYVLGMDQFGNNLIAMEAFGEPIRDNRAIYQLDVKNNSNTKLFDLEGYFAGVAFVPGTRR